MQEDKKTKRIGDNLYGCRKLPAELGLRALAKLMNLIGPSIKEWNDGDNGGNLAGVVSALLSNEKLGDQLEYFASVFSQHSTLEKTGQSIELSGIYSLHFAGNYLELVQWLIFCFEVNHGRFLAGAGLSVESFLLAVEEKLLSRSQKQQGKPGRSGASSSAGDSMRPTAT